MRGILQNMWLVTHKTVNINKIKGHLRICHSQGEPMEGKIAVGNVVLNRVEHSTFPNTIYGVIFDRRYGVQFTPAANGTIYNTPYYLSVIAAKICLEGETVSDKVIYFLEPSLSTSFWIVENCTFAFEIGCHDFYY